MTIDNAIEKFVNHAQSHDETAPKHWYAGITSNPEERKKQHEYSKGIECKHFKSMKCENESIAKKLEQELKKCGFAIHTRDLVIMEGKTKPKNYVYVYKAVKSSEPI